MDFNELINKVDFVNLGFEILTPIVFLIADIISRLYSSVN